MGYTTDFNGTLTITPAPTKEFKEYINKFSCTRHMKRDELKLMLSNPDWKDNCFNGNIGNQCAYYVQNDYDKFSYNDPSVIDHNTPPDNVPGLWCQWIINDNNELAWDGGEKFYHYVEWLEYLIKNFFVPENLKLNGEIYWYGESYDDTGCIKVTNNIVKVGYGRIVYDF